MFTARLRRHVADRGDVSSLTMPDGAVESWSYDGAGRPLTVANEQSETTTNAYDAAGRLSTTTFANGQVSVLGYDARSRQSSVAHKTSATGSAISSEAYVYDDAGNLSSKTVDGTTTTYGYDDADQLTSESRTGYSASYTYDANGNRTSKTLGGVTDAYAIDDGDKLTSVTEGATTVKSYTYDAAGRTKTVVSSAGATTLSYDYEGRVTGITYPGAATNSFTYNGLDARVGKVDSAGTSTYRRDGADVTDDVLSDGAAVYTPGVGQRRGGATTYDLSDRLGAATRQTSAAASTTATRTYDAFGALVASSGTPLGPFGFAGASGYQEDGDSGLKLLGHRDYDPSTGRFLTRDPVKDGRNWYAYCENNPLRSVDADGLSWAGIVIGVGQHFGDKGPYKPWDGDHLPYRTPEGAAGGGIAGAMPGTKKDGMERGGSVYPVDGGYKPSEPTVGTNLDGPGTTDGSAVAYWHTHPFPNNPPSNADYNRTLQSNVPEYVGDTSGNLWVVMPGIPPDRLPRHDPYIGPCAPDRRGLGTLPAAPTQGA